LLLLLLLMLPIEPGGAVTEVMDDNEGCGGGLNEFEITELNGDDNG
jgi:hypothetical protein